MSLREQMEQHLEFLFADSDPDRFINLRAIPADHENHSVLEEFFPVRELEAAAEFAERVAETHSVHVGVAARDHRSGKAEAVSQVGFVWVDLDKPEAVAALEEFSIVSSLVVKSGSNENRHAYWKLTEPVDPGEVEELNSRLIARLDADKGCRDRARVMRLAGSLNHKQSPPVPAEIVTFPDTRHEIGDFENVLEPLAVKESKVSKGSRPRPRKWDGDTSPVVQRVLNELEVTGGGEGQWRAHCPAHDDQSPSLSVAQGDDGCCLIRCHAGCETEEVVAAIGLTMADLRAPGTQDKSQQLAMKLLGSAESRNPELFSSPDGKAWISVTVEGGRETWELGSQEAKRWLQRVFYEDHEKAVRAEILQDVRGILEAKARFDGAEHEVPVRVSGEPSGPIYLDIIDKRRRAVKLEADGPSVVKTPPVYFRRASSAGSLPHPDFDGEIGELKPFVNVRDEAAWMRLVGFLLMCFHPTGPYPVLTLSGEQGSAKSTLSRLILSLVDPHAAGLLSGSTRIDDLALAASTSWLVALDNISTIKPTLSDTLCRVSTGGGLRRRRLYTDTGEVAIEFRRPVLLNGIGSVVKAPDLLERSVPVELVPISPENRRTEADLNSAWETARPRVFGGLMTAVSAILAQLGQVKLKGHPRMADFALWGEAAADHLGWQPGEFSSAIESGQEEQVELSIDDQPEIRGLIDMLNQVEEVNCPATELLSRVHQFINAEPNTSGLSRNPAQFSRLLSVYEPVLRKHGITIERNRGAGGNRDRSLRVTKA